MNIKKTAAVLAALAMAGSVCLPVSAENETDAEVMTVYYDHTDAAEEESAEDVQVFSEEEGEYTPGETEDTAVTTDNTASYDTDSDLVSVAYYDENGDFAGYREVEESAEANADGLIDEEAYYNLTAGWCDWDESTGILTLKGQLPNTYWVQTDASGAGKAFDIATLSGVNPFQVKKLVITPGTKAGASLDQFCRDMENLTEVEGLSNLDTSSVTTMKSMFCACPSLKAVDLSGLDTRKVKDMGAMFNYDYALTEVDMSGLDTSKVENMNYMFGNCENLKSIVVSNKWNTSSVTDSKEMFKKCTALTGGKGTTFNTGKIDKTYAVIDKGSSQPGYLTALTSIEIKPVFGGRTVKISSYYNNADIYYNYGSSNITTSSDRIKAGSNLFIGVPKSGADAAMYFKVYRNGKWSDVQKWGVLNVKLDQPKIVQSGPKSDNKVKIYSQAKDTYLIYTTDGSTPSVIEGSNKLEIQNGTIIWGTSGVVSVPRGKTVKAIAVRCGLVTSDPAEYKNS